MEVTRNAEGVSLGIAEMESDCSSGCVWSGDGSDEEVVSETVSERWMVIVAFFVVVGAEIENDSHCVHGSSRQMEKGMPNNRSDCGSDSCVLGKWKDLLD